MRIRTLPAPDPQKPFGWPFGEWAWECALASGSRNFWSHSAPEDPTTPASLLARAARLFGDDPTFRTGAAP